LIGLESLKANSEWVRKCLRHQLVCDFSLHLRKFRQPEKEHLKVLIVCLADLYAICLLESLWSFELRATKTVMFQEAFT